MFRGHYGNPTWYDKKSPLDKHYYKVLDIYTKAKEAKRVRTLANPLDYIITHPDNEIRWEV